MFKKLLFLVGLGALAAFLVKKARSANDERALWHEATTAPDLR